VPVDFGGKGVEIVQKYLIDVYLSVNNLVGA
jgi:hypothetical protein